MQRHAALRSALAHRRNTMANSIIPDHLRSGVARIVTACKRIMQIVAFIFGRGYSCLAWVLITEILIVRPARTERRPRRVAQVFLPAVSPTFQSADRATARRFRFLCDRSAGGASQVGKPAIRQTGKSALRRETCAHRTDLRPMQNRWEDDSP